MEKEIESFDLEDVSNADSDLDQLVSAAEKIVELLNTTCRNTKSLHVPEFAVDAGNGVISTKIKHKSNEAAKAAADIISCDSVSVENVSTSETKYSDHVTYYVEIDPDEW